MQNHTIDSDMRRNRLWGTLFTVFYTAAFVCLFLWGSLNIEASEQSVRGMVVDFGQDETGVGVEDTALADPTPLPKPDQTPAEPEPVVTQQIEEAPAVVEHNREENPKVIEKVQQATEKSVDNEQPLPREVDSRALFKGNKPDSQSSSEGVSEGVGNRGAANGTVSDTHQGDGCGEGFEPDWSLEGRRPRNAFPRPGYHATEHGLVVIEIWVDNTGAVTHAEYRAKGSTVSTKSPLIGAAIKAAYGARFDESDQDLQVGTITYSFNLDTKARR